MRVTESPMPQQFVGLTGQIIKDVQFPHLVLSRCHLRLLAMSRVLQLEDHTAGTDILNYALCLVELR